MKEYQEAIDDVNGVINQVRAFVDLNYSGLTNMDIHAVLNRVRTLSHDLISQRLKAEEKEKKK